MDRFGRKVTNLRISVTPRCNLNCIFCHREGYTPQGCNREGSELPLEKIVEVVSVTARHGIDSVKLTGGEPLLRWDIVDIVRGVSELVDEVSMVSNGVLLSPLAGKLKDAGLSRINVSLHSLKPSVYAKITRSRRDNFDLVVEGIREARDAGIGVKINFTVLKGLNEGEIWDMVKFASAEGVNLQLIEYHSPNFVHPDFKKWFYSLKQVEEKLEVIAARSYRREMHRRRRFVLDSGIYVEVVRPMFNPEFCAHCSRLRVVGHEFKPCLMRSDNHVDFSKDIESALFEAIKRREPFFK